MVVVLLELLHGSHFQCLSKLLCLSLIGYEWNIPFHHQPWRSISSHLIADGVVKVHSSQKQCNNSWFIHWLLLDWGGRWIDCWRSMVDSLKGGLNKTKHKQNGRNINWVYSGRNVLCRYDIKIYQKYLIVYTSEFIALLFMCSWFSVV